MNISSLKSQLSFKKPTLRRGRRLQTRLRPHRAWVVGLVLSIFLVTGSALWGGYVFWTLDAGFVEEDTAAVTIPYDVIKVDEALTKFRARAETFTAGRAESASAPVSVIEIPEPEPAEENPATSSEEAVIEENPSIEAGSEEVPDTNEPVRPQ